MLLKNIACLLIINGLILFLQSGCAPADNPEDTKTVVREEQKHTGIKVTFVELGSVKCIPCKKMQPIMDAIKNEYEGQVKVVFHDVWSREGRPYAEKYKIRLIPTQVFLDSNGKEYFRHEGYLSKNELVRILKMKGVI